MLSSLLSSRAQLLPEKVRRNLPVTRSPRKIGIILALTGTFLVLVCVSVGLKFVLKPGAPLLLDFGPAVEAIKRTALANARVDNTNSSSNGKYGLTGRYHGSVAQRLGLISRRAINETGSERPKYFGQGGGTDDA